MVLDRSATLVWFERDLRHSDNPALTAAAARGGPIVPLFVLDEHAPGIWCPGGASLWWLHHSLDALDRRLGEHGGRLLLRRGPARALVPEIASELKVGAVLWNRRYEPWAAERDDEVARNLTARGIEARTFNGALLFEPSAIRTERGAPYRVYSPFVRACRQAPEPPAPLEAPNALNLADGGLAGDRLDDWRLLPTAPDWAAGLRATWKPGEDAAEARLAEFLAGPIADYAEDRDRPDLEATSRLSPHLHFGEIGPRAVWHAVRGAQQRAANGRGAEVFLNEVLWREFAHHLLHQVPSLPEQPLDSAFAGFAWREDAEALRAWQRGRTGYPIVDAAMRELRSTGWMHNRARMIVGSFLVKDLLLPWQAGASWFWDNLVDADLANNSLGWQWVAGCGPDAAPYFRIFNPVRQGERFDPGGAYVRRLLPELEGLPAPHCHAPWLAPRALLEEAGVRLGTTYPLPIVDHGRARARALAAFNDIQRAKRALQRAGGGRGHWRR